MESEPLADLRPILWKWLIRLIWVGSIVVLQIAELHRYLTGQTYRPFFGLYAGVLLALFLWFFVTLLANLERAHKTYNG
jgi:hypothetical protein